MCGLFHGSGHALGAMGFTLNITMTIQFSIRRSRPVALLRVGIAVLFSALLPAMAIAHGGGLDAAGCHHDRKNGGYHCHRAPAAADRQGTADRTRLTVYSHASTASRPSTPTCLVGPRGGTYTLTASGRKNYAGC